MAHNMQRIPAASLYGASYMPFPTHANTATLAALQKNAAMAAAATYGGYAGYMPQAFPTAATFQMPFHDVYQTYWDTHSINHNYTHRVATGHQTFTPHPWGLLVNWTTQSETDIQQN